MANDTTLHASLRTALRPALAQVIGVNATEANNAWKRIDKITSASGMPLFQLRTLYSVITARDSNNILDELAVEVVAAYRISTVGGALEQVVRDRVRIVSQTLSRPAWWEAIDTTQIMRLSDGPELTLERIGRALILSTRVRLTLKP